MLRPARCRLADYVLGAAGWVSADKAVRLARADRLAVHVFGDAAKAHRWLRKPKRLLRGETPLVYLATETGARVVEEMLHQIDHGILA